MPDSLFSPEYSRLCSVLVNARQQTGLTQTELARRLKRPQSFVSKYERAERRLDVVEFVEVVRALDLDPVEVLDRVLSRSEPGQ